MAPARKPRAGVEKPTRDQTHCQGGPFHFTSCAPVSCPSGHSGALHFPIRFQHNPLPPFTLRGKLTETHRTLFPSPLPPHPGAPKTLSARHLRTLRMTDDVLCVRFSPDGKLLAVSLLDATVKARRAGWFGERRRSPPLPPCLARQPGSFHGITRRARGVCVLLLPRCPLAPDTLNPPNDTRERP